MLVVLSTIKVERCRRILPLLLIGPVLVCLYLYGVSLWRDKYFFPSAESSRVVRSAAECLSKSALNPTRTVIVIDGSSHASRGINGPLLSKLLNQQKNPPVTVIQLSLTGGNHLERLFMHRLLKRVTNGDDWNKLTQSKILLLREISPGYDLSPTAQCEGNWGTERTYAYMEPAVAMDAARFLRESDKWSLIQLSLIARHAVVNGFAAGRLETILAGITPAPAAAYMPLLPSTREFVHPGINIVRMAIRRPSIPPLPPNYAWLDTEHREILSVYAGISIRPVWFSAPTLRSAFVYYTNSRLSSLKTEVNINVYDSDAACAELWTKLDNPKCWFDEGHLSNVGAEIYTGWLAKKIVDSGLLFQ